MQLGLAIRGSSAQMELAKKMNSAVRNRMIRSTGRRRRSDPGSDGLSDVLAGQRLDRHGYSSTRG